jgi:hypothetical protein
MRQFFMQREEKHLFETDGEESKLVRRLLIITEILAITGSRLFPASMVLQSCHFIQKMLAADAQYVIKSANIFGFLNAILWSKNAFDCCCGIDVDGHRICVGL